jgi:hypothetical protein
MVSSIDWNRVASFGWEFLNSPAGIVLATVGLGGIFANWLGARWQLRALRYQVQLKAYSQFQTDYMGWFYAINAGEKDMLPHLIRAVASLTYLRSLCRRLETLSRFTRMMAAMQRATMEVAENPTTTNASQALANHKIHSHYELVLANVALELGIRGRLYSFSLGRVKKETQDG